MFLPGLEIDEVDLVLSKTERGLDRFHEPGAVFLGNREAILNDLDAGAEPESLRVAIRPDNFAVQPDAQVTLLLKKGEELLWLGFWWNRNPKRDQDAGEIVRRRRRRKFKPLKNFIGDRFRGFRPDLAPAGG